MRYLCPSDLLTVCSSADKFNLTCAYFATLSTHILVCIVVGLSTSKFVTAFYSERAGLFTHDNISYRTHTVKYKVISDKQRNNKKCLV